MKKKWIAPEECGPDSLRIKRGSLSGHTQAPPNDGKWRKGKRRPWKIKNPVAHIKFEKNKDFFYFTGKNTALILNQYNKRTERITIMNNTHCKTSVKIKPVTERTITMKNAAGSRAVSSSLVKIKPVTERTITMKNAAGSRAVSSSLVKIKPVTERTITMKNAAGSRAVSSSLVKIKPVTERTITMKKTSGCAAQNVGNTAKHVYEATVKARAISRAGSCNNLNGHILEIMGADKTNLNPFNGLKETLTKSRTATAVDSYVTKGKTIVQRIQYKDTAKSLGDTVRRVKAGQYQSVTLKGTSETAEVFNRYAAKHGIAKRMQDTGISSNTTKALARSCGAAKQISLARAAGMAAKSGGLVGGAVSGGLSLISNTIAVANGEKEVGEALGCVAKDTTGGVLSGAGSAAAATVTGAAVASAVAGTAIAGTAIGTACVVAAPVAVAIGVGCAISAVWNALWD